MTNHISTIKAEFKAAQQDEAKALVHWFKAGQAGESAVSADDEATNKSVAEAAGVSASKLSKCRNIARTFSSITKLRQALKDAELTESVDNAYSLCKGDRGPQTTSVVELGERFGKAHAEWTDDEFNKFVAAARKARKAAK